MQFKNIKKDYNFRIEKKLKNISSIFLNTLKKTFPDKVFIKQQPLTRKSKIKNICTETGLERSTTVSLFGHSRHVFKIKNIKLFYPGIRKASW